MQKSKFDTLYQQLVDNGYDYDRVTNNGGNFRIHVYKGGKDHLITWKGPKEEYQHFIYLVRKYIYDNEL